MKKILCAVLCVIFLFSFAACAKKQLKEESTAEGTTAQAETTTEKEKKKEEKKKPTWVSETTKEKTTKKGSLKDTVKVTLPLAMLDEKYQNDLDAYCRDNGYEKAKLNKRTQTVTVTMKALSYELMLTNVGMQVIGAIYEIAESKDYPYINKIEACDSDNFKSVVYSVDPKTYPKNSAASYMMAQSCMLYQLYCADTDYRVDITVIDRNTNEIIETVTYTDKEIIN